MELPSVVIFRTSCRWGFVCPRSAGNCVRNCPRWGSLVTKPKRLFKPMKTNCLTACRHWLMRRAALPAVHSPHGLPKPSISRVAHSRWMLVIQLAWSRYQPALTFSDRVIATSCCVQRGNDAWICRRSIGLPPMAPWPRPAPSLHLDRTVMASFPVRVRVCWCSSGFRMQCVMAMMCEP